MTDGFKEGRGHWWLSRVVIPVAIPLTVALLGLGGVLYVNRDRLAGGSVDGAAAPTASPQPDGRFGGWGPLRDMYTHDHPSPTATFNSIIDNVAVGDERNFVRCRIASDPNMKYSDDVAISHDTEIAVWIGIDNSSTDPRQTIFGAHLQLVLGKRSDTVATVNVNLIGDNVAEVWDGCRVIAPQHVDLSYVPGTAVLHTGDGEISLSDDVIRNEALLPGSKGQAPGTISGESEYYGQLELRLQAFISS